MATANPVSIQPKTSTAEDTLQRKSRDAGVISGGHLVAKALTKSESGKQVLEKLVKHCDVLVENFARGALKTH